MLLILKKKRVNPGYISLLLIITLKDDAWNIGGSLNKAAKVKLILDLNFVYYPTTNHYRYFVVDAYLGKKIK